MDLDARRRLTLRALGLASVICRGHIEGAAADPKAKEMHDLVLRWLLDTGAWYALDRDEGLIVAGAPGSLSRAQVALALFRSEQLSVVAWACGVVPLPRHDHSLFDRHLASRVSFLRPDAIERLESKTLVDPDRLRLHARRAAAIEDRLRRFAVDGEPLDFKEKYGDMRVPLVNGDLAIGELPLWAVTEASWQVVLAAAVERSSAASWLLEPTGAMMRRPIDA